MTEKDKIRVGVIGCGAGLFHLEGYAEEPRAEVVALARGGLNALRCRTFTANIRNCWRVTISMR